MSRGNEHPSAKSVREHNAATFQKFKKKLVDGNLQSDPVKWVRVAHTFLEFVCDARIYYDEARSDIVDCVEIATNAVENRVPGELRHLRPIAFSHVPEAYRSAYDELKRLLVVVGSYQSEMLLPPKGGESRPDLLSRITTCIAAFGIDPDVLLDKTSLDAAMLSVSLDDKSRQSVLKSIAKRKPDGVSVVASTRSTPSIATPVLSVASTLTTASPQITSTTTPTAHSGPTPVPMHVAVPHVPPQVLTQDTVSSPTTPTAPVRPNTGTSKPRKQPKWMAQDLDKYRKEKMANSGQGTATPTAQQPASPVVPRPPVVPQVQPPAVAPTAAPNQSPAAQVEPALIAVAATSPVPVVTSHYHAAEDAKPATATHHRPAIVDTRPPEASEIVTKVSEAMDVDTPVLDEPAPPEDKPLPYTLPPLPHESYTSPPAWSDLFAEAINAAHEHKLSIGDMIRYVTTVYPTLKSARNAAGAMFNSKLARQTGRSTALAGTVADEIHVAKKAQTAPRFVRTADVYPVTWTLEGSDETKSTSSDAASVEAGSTANGEPAPVAVKQELPDVPSEATVVATNTAVVDVAPESAQDAPAPNTAPPLPYTLRPGPYTPAKPTKALAALVQEAILAGIPDKALTQSDILSYIRTVYPFYALIPNLEDEVVASLRQHFALKDDGRWSIWIRDGSDEDEPLPFMLPPGPRSSAKPDRPLLDLISEAISASNEGCLTQRDVAAYVLSVAPFYNGAEEPLPFGQLLREHFIQRGFDAEGRVLWSLKDAAPTVDVPTDVAEEIEPMATDSAEFVQEPITSVAVGSRASSRPPKYKGPPKSAAVVDSGDESGLETPITPVTPSTVGATPVVSSPTTEAPPPPRPATVSRLFVLPPGPYTSHKPPKKNEEVVLEAFRASITGQLRKKEIALYIQTVYPWFRRDERAILSCNKMIEHMLTKLKGAAITRIDTGLYRFNGSQSGAGPSASKERQVAQHQGMDAAAQQSARSAPSSILKIRIPARQVSGDASSSVLNKRAARTASPAESESPSMPKRIKLILPDRPGAVPSQINGDASSVELADSTPKPKPNGTHICDPPATPGPKAAASLGQQPDIEMQDGLQPVETPGPLPLPPLSFGQDACPVDVAFGRPMAASFTLHVNPRPEQWAMVEKWRNGARNDDDLSDALCYSIACYRSEDVHALKDDVATDVWGNVLVRTEIPVSLHNQALHSLCLTGNGRTIPFPLTWMSASASPLFLDISSYLIPGDNMLTLAHTADLSAFTFVIIAHRPNAHQLRWLDTRREPWRRLQAQINNVMQVPQLDYAALLLSSKDVSKVDLDRGVPQESLTLP